MKYDFIEDRDRLVEEKLLRCDDRGDLRIYTYTSWCKTWNNLTLNSRGIIFNRKTGEVVARPFPKFFNMNQTVETSEWKLPWLGGLRLFKKQDGWMGILYRDGGQHRIATRGSFKSTGAIWATEFLKRYDLTGLPDEVTLLFELICPATHIVVDYGDREDLVLLAAYNRHTGEEYDWSQVEQWGDEFGFTLTESYEKDWLGFCRGQIKTVPGNELEGFVIRFENGLRVKIKSEDYFRRSSLLANLTPLTIWNNMVDGKVMKDVWDQVDKEYHCLLDAIADELEDHYVGARRAIFEEFSGVSNLDDRHYFAQSVVKMKHKPAMFMMFDGHNKSLDDYIMKMIRPHNNVL